MRREDLRALSGLASLRQVGYRLFGVLFLYPDRRRLGTVRAAAGALRRESGSLVGFAFFDSCQQLLAVLGKLRAGTANIEEEYVHLFAVNPEAPPYESSYLDPQGQSHGWVAARLAREYADAGLDVSPSLNEPSDHAAVELEFMAFLCDTEARAWEEQAVEEGIQSLARQRLFLTEHLDQWFPAFARRILRVDRGRFYTVVAEAAQAFTHHDGDLLDLLLHQGRVAGAAAASEWRAGVTA